MTDSQYSGLQPSDSGRFPALGPDEETRISELAAVGLAPVEIAMAMDWDRDRRKLFVRLATVPGSDVFLLIASGRAQGRSDPQLKLREAAVSGNLDAIKNLQLLQEKNRFIELMNYMDDDELTD